MVEKITPWDVEAKWPEQYGKLVKQMGPPGDWEGEGSYGPTGFSMQDGVLHWDDGACGWSGVFWDPRHHEWFDWDESPDWRDPEYAEIRIMPAGTEMDAAPMDERR